MINYDQGRGEKNTCLYLCLRTVAVSVADLILCIKYFIL